MHRMNDLIKEYQGYIPNEFQRITFQQIVALFILKKAY